MLQERMMVGHVLTVGSSMSDATLVKAAEEVRGLIRVTRGKGRRARAGTVVLTAPDPARSLLLGTAFEVVVPGAGGSEASILESARNVEILLDWLAMTTSSDLSFVLDARYRSLLSEGDQALADALTGLTGHLRSRTSAPSPSPLSQTVSAFLDDLGEQ